MKFDPSRAGTSVVLDPVTCHAVPTAALVQAIAGGSVNRLRKPVEAALVPTSHPERVVHAVNDRQ
jgi:hypothetical protein